MTIIVIIVIVCVNISIVVNIRAMMIAIIMIDTVIITVVIIVIVIMIVCYYKLYHHDCQLHLTPSLSSHHSSYSLLDVQLILQPFEVARSDGLTIHLTHRMVSSMIQVDKSNFREWFDQIDTIITVILFVVIVEQHHC